MTVDQISVFLENKPGTLSQLTQALFDGNINMRALSLADSKDFGIVRIIADDPVKADEILWFKKASCSSKRREASRFSSFTIFLHNKI